MNAVVQTEQVAEPGMDRKLIISDHALETPGYEVVEIKKPKELFSLPYENGSLDTIVASWVLQCVELLNLPLLLEYWVGLLRPGGELFVAVPDVGRLAQSYLQQNQRILFHSRVMGDGVAPMEIHRSVHDRGSLHQMLGDAGLHSITRWDSTLADRSSMPISLNLTGIKSVSNEMITPGLVRGLLSAPRFGPTIHWQHSANALQALGINYTVAQGAFWHQVLTNALEKILPNHQFVLICDYDSIFKDEDVLELVRLGLTHPYADAIFPLQMRRRNDTVLGATQTTVYTHHMTQDLIAMGSGHFGCTLLRSSSFEKLEKPWFLGIPSKDGTWGDGHVDADIYFWRQWAKAGNNCLLAPSVRIGHVEENILWPDQNLKPIFQRPDDYHREGPPINTWNRNNIQQDTEES